MFNGAAIAALLPGRRFSEMPYGVVMASAGAGRVAGLMGLSRAALALTSIAIIQALLIPIGHALGNSGIRPPQWRPGLFTIPLGLAVIAGNLGSLVPKVACIILGLAWLVTLALGCWWLARVSTRTDKTTIVDGTWFLAPAALLGVAGASAAAMGAPIGPEIILPIIACLVGVTGYAWVIATAGRQLCRRGLRGAPLAPWWISAGCGGLAAAMLARLTGLVPSGLLQSLLSGLMIATWIAGTLLLIAVLTGCVGHARTRTRTRGTWRHVWPPVFSTAVYAAGTASVAGLRPLPWLDYLAALAMAATLALWVINSSLWLVFQLKQPQ